MHAALAAHGSDHPFPPSAVFLRCREPRGIAPTAPAQLTTPALPLCPGVRNHAALRAALAAQACRFRSATPPSSPTPGVENHAAMHAALAANSSDAAYDPRCVPVFVDHKYNCLPHFIIGGVPKAGTTSLYKYLMQHPDMVPAQDKEITFWGNFFTPKRRPGRDEVMSDYLTRFPKISPSDFKVCIAKASNSLSARLASCCPPPRQNERLFHLLPKDLTLGLQGVRCASVWRSRLALHPAAPRRTPAIYVAPPAGDRRGHSRIPLLPSLPTAPQTCPTPTSPFPLPPAAHVTKATPLTPRISGARRRPSTSSD
jgi:hypothetical protein